MDMMCKIVHVTAGVLLAVENFAYDWSALGDFAHRPPPLPAVVVMLAGSIAMHLPARTVAINNAIIVIATVVVTLLFEGSIEDTMIVAVAMGSTAISASLAAVVAEKEAREQFVLSLAVHNATKAKLRSSEMDEPTEVSRIQPQAGIANHIHRWTLRFKAPDLEREYQIYHAENNMAFTRRVSLYIMGMYIFLTVQDVFSTIGTKYSDLLGLLLIVRLCIVLPCMFLGYGLTWWSRYAEYRSNYIIPCWCLVWALGDNYVSSLFPVISFQAFMYDIVLYRIIITTTSIVRVDFVAALLVIIPPLVYYSWGTQDLNGLLLVFAVSFAGALRSRRMTFNSRYKMFMSRQHEDATSETSLNSMTFV
eukprot:GFYU01011849.1.p1 GENE.GFYU01011849.1~~GFYU01011849.1.p1  ORF type:complete len:363 (+),score=46.76 GFYU01011849.1:317-1405(+)